MSHKENHEVRDAIHVFVRLSADERRVLDSSPFQRLRDIHQLAMTYLVYPGATHKRFEHSLGVMELASRVFDIVTNDENLSSDTKAMLGKELAPKTRDYWRSVLRVAALVHDIGHLPFSHAAEKELLPANTSHEHVTRTLIETDDMKAIWEGMTPPLRAEDIVKLAVGPEKARDLEFTPWEALISEIISGDAFGVDRIDYLLRDSYHLGVAYGRFDHYRLIDNLRIIVTTVPNAPPSMPSGGEEANLRRIESSRAPDRAEPTPRLGIERGGLQSAEALALARYYMYTQVYFHPVRRAYDIHLKDFMLAWLKGGRIPTKPAQFLNLSDSNVITALRESASKPSSSGHIHATRIMRRQHFRVVYERNPIDMDRNPDARSVIFQGLSTEFGDENVRESFVDDTKTALDFPVRLQDDRIAWARSLSSVLAGLPSTSVDYVLVNREISIAVKTWLDRNRDDLLSRIPEGEN